MRVMVILSSKTGYECHKHNCRDLGKKRPYVQTSWTEDSLEEAEVNFNNSLGVNAGYEDPWVWSEHVIVFPCTKTTKESN